MTSSELQRPHGRAADQLRPVEIERGVLKFAEGSALISIGDTKVLAAATIETRVPPFLVDSDQGWATAEYAMLPRATTTRSPREVSRGRPSGRSAEIQRLIGRSLRAVLDLGALPGRTLTLDCDVLQADGGTRTASVTAAYVAAVEALAALYAGGEIDSYPVREPVAAVSVGVVDGAVLLDLEASEDQRATVDLNVVGTPGGHLIELQGTGEERSFSRSELDGMLDLAFQGIERMAREQSRALESVLADVDAVRRHGERRAARPQDEDELWGAPE